MMAIQDLPRRSLMPRPIHFEIHAENPQRAIKFYTDLFGWTFSKWNGPQDYWLIKTGEPGTPGIDGGLLPRRGAGDAGDQRVCLYGGCGRPRRGDAHGWRSGHEDRRAEDGDPWSRMARLCK